MRYIAFVMAMLFSVNALAFEWEVLVINGKTRETTTYRTSERMTLKAGKGMTCSFSPDKVEKKDLIFQSATLGCSDGDMTMIFFVFCASVSYADGSFVSIVGRGKEAYEIRGKCIRP